ncbi:hypothetical protein BDZ45DRAFT_812342 [Acephala macrosclerotiorum]|nr:hypothetical protein BDZ45DRAFT_812342 [Acephala macrosclerotiorum]
MARRAAAVSSFLACFFDSTIQRFIRFVRFIRFIRFIRFYDSTVLRALRFYDDFDPFDPLFSFRPIYDLLIEPFYGVGTLTATSLL